MSNLPVKIDLNKPPGGGLRAKRAATQIQHTELQQVAQEQRLLIEQQATELNPLDMPNKLIIVFDDSGSMSGEAIIKAKKAVDSFLDSCNPLDTSVGVATLDNEHIIQPLSCVYSQIKEKVKHLDAVSGTPLFETLWNVYNDSSNNKEVGQDLPASVQLTRCIVFSDGSPDNKRFENLDPYIKNIPPIPIDTVYIGRSRDDIGYSTLKQIADKTGGQCLHFDNMNTFVRNLRYLAPTNYGLLAAPTMREAVEKGEI